MSTGICDQTSKNATQTVSVEPQSHARSVFGWLVEETREQCEAWDDCGLARSQNHTDGCQCCEIRGKGMAEKYNTPYNPNLISGHLSLMATETDLRTYTKIARTFPNGNLTMIQVRGNSSLVSLSNKCRARISSQDWAYQQRYNRNRRLISGRRQHIMGNCNGLCALTHR